MRILLINGPNLNLLGQREPDIYGTLTLADIEARVAERAKALNVELRTFQSNHEGAIVDFLQQEAPSADGIILNGGALTHYGLSLRDALLAVGKPAIEVHISNIYGRERYRQRSVTADVCRGIIAGLGWYGYIAALEALAQESK
ncbi:MAG: type II 3-dehydroquinate dehydratase [Dehalococcoidia bacterium]